MTDTYDPLGDRRGFGLWDYLFPPDVTGGIIPTPQSGMGLPGGGPMMPGFHAGPGMASGPAIPAAPNEVQQIPTPSAMAPPIPQPRPFPQIFQPGADMVNMPPPSAPDQAAPPSGVQHRGGVEKPGKDRGYPPAPSAPKPREARAGRMLELMLGTGQMHPQTSLLLSRLLGGR